MGGLLISHMEKLNSLYFGDGEKVELSINPSRSNTSPRKWDPALPCQLKHRPLSVYPWLPEAPLLFLAEALALEEWFPSNTTDVFQIIHNGTFQSSSRYFRRAFLSRNPKCFSRLSLGAGMRRRHMNVFSWRQELGPDPCFLPFGLLQTGLEVSLCT